MNYKKQKIKHSYLLFSKVPSKPKFVVTYRATTFFNVSFDPTAMAIPGSLYYVQYKTDERGSYESNIRKLIISMLGFLDGESLYWFHFAGMALILVGVYLVNRKS